MAKVIGGEVLFMVTEGMCKWLDSHNARIVGKTDGKIILALDDEDFKGLEEELFNKERKGGTNV